MDSLQSRLDDLERRYQQQQTVIANQQAEIHNKIRFGDDYRTVRGDDDL